MSILSVGITGLNAAQVGMLTTSHNISNASTPGYSRQEIVQGTNNPSLTGVGFIGQGTHVATVKRNYDEFLGRQVLSAETSVSEMNAYLAQIRQIDNLLADPASGLSPAMADFFKGVQSVAANPDSIPSRQSMLSAAQSLVARFQSLDQRMTEIRDGTNSQIMGQVGAVNTYVSQLADINQRIIIARASGSGTQQPNDLLDQRDQILRDLNQVIRITTVTQSDGSLNVFFGSGQPLVIGGQSYALAAVAAPGDPERIVVALKAAGGAVLNLPESQITGGTLGGLVAFRGQTLDSAQNSLGRIALTLAQNFNDQHKLGMDLTGALGLDFFTMSSPVLRANTTPPANGSPTVAIDTATTNNITMLTASDYRLSYAAGQYTLVRLSDNKAFPPVASLSPPLQVDGLLIDAGTWSPLADGESYLIQPTRTGAREIAMTFSDARMIAAAAPVRTSAALTNTGTGSIDSGVVLDTTNAAFANFNTTGELTPPIFVQFDSPTSYTIWSNGTPAIQITPPVTYTPGANILYPGADPASPNPSLLTADFGYQVKISGSPATGDRFMIGGNKNGVSDNRNAMLLGALQTQKTMAASTTTGPTASYQSAYSQIVSAVGTKTHEVDVIAQAQQGVADQANNALQQLAGVNLDEEAANLLRYQQAYQASAKILATASKIFDEILALGA